MIWPYKDYWISDHIGFLMSRGTTHAAMECKIVYDI